MELWNSVGNVSSVVGIISAIPIFWTLYEVKWGRKRKHEIWYDQAVKGTNADIVLVVDLLANSDMRTQVRQYLATQNHNVPDDRFVVLEHSGDIKPHEVPELVRQLRNHIDEISRMGAGSLHIFFGGPCAFATIVGCEMSNRGNVFIYHHPRTGGYESWGPVRHEHF